MENLHDIRNNALKLETICTLLQENSEDFKRSDLLRDAKIILAEFEKFLDNFKE